MAKRQNKNSYFSNISFVNIRIDAAQKKAFKKWFEEHQADAEVLLHDFITGGWKMSVRWDDEGDCFIVAHTNVDEASEHHNFCITSRSDLMVEAMLLNYFKFAVIANGALADHTAADNWG